MDRHRGQLYVISAPSGVGKTTIIKSILAELPELCYSISCTTRAPRAGETAGVDYHFLTEGEFKRGIAAGRFLEWAHVHGKYYGTDGVQLEAWVSDGRDVILDIDVQGARQVRLAYPEARTIFIIPPSMAVLEERLRSRGTESAEQLAIRKAAAQRELVEAPWYETIIVNNVLEEAIADLRAVLHAGRCRAATQALRLRALLASITPA